MQFVFVMGENITSIFSLSRTIFQWFYYEICFLEKLTFSKPRVRKNISNVIMPSLPRDFRNLFSTALSRFLSHDVMFVVFLKVNGEIYSLALKIFLIERFIIQETRTKIIDPVKLKVFVREKRRKKMVQMIRKKEEMLVTSWLPAFSLFFSH